MNFRILPIILLMTTLKTEAQVVNPTQPTTEITEIQKGNYTLKGIFVDGVKKYSPEQILRFT